MEQFKKTFLGNERIDLVNEINNQYPSITIKEFVESYFSSKESFGIKPVETNRWFFQSYDFNTRKIVNNEITQVQISSFEGVGYQIKGQYYQKPIILIESPSTEIIVKNVLSYKILPVEIQLANKWQEMYNIPVLQGNKVIWDKLGLMEIPISGNVYTIYFKNPLISVNNILV